MLGTLVNTGAILFGSLLGLLLRRGLPQRLRDTVMQGLGLCGSCGSRWTRLHFYQTASLAHAVGAGVSTLEAPVHGVVYCHPIPPPACVNLPPAAWHRYRGGTICSTPAGGTSYLTTYLLQSSTEEGLLRFTVALQKGR